MSVHARLYVLSAGVMPVRSTDVEEGSDLSTSFQDASAPLTFYLAACPSGGLSSPNRAAAALPVELPVLSSGDEPMLTCFHYLPVVRAAAVAAFLDARIAAVLPFSDVKRWAVRHEFSPLDYACNCLANPLRCARAYVNIKYDNILLPISKFQDS